MTMAMKRLMHEIHNETAFALLVSVFFTSNKNITPIKGTNINKLSNGIFMKSCIPSYNKKLQRLILSVFL
jgi:DNA integrity scanning protein DisA with diadenylate cyclase activity